jgi:hypothetical protein
MASEDSEVYRINSQEDIGIDTEISKEVSDSQRQVVEMSSQEDLEIDREVSKEVRSYEKEAITPPNIIQILLNMQDSLKESREENKRIKESLTEKMEENQNSLMDKIERSQDSLREMREENQNNLKRIEEMQASLREECINIRIDNQMSIDRLENNMMNLEERVERFISQTDQHSNDLHEMENRIAKNARDENGKLKEYIDATMSKKIVRVKGELTEIANQVDNKLQELNANDKGRNKRLDEKVQEINTSMRVGQEYLEIKITELSSKVENIQLQGRKEKVGRIR